MYCLKATVTTKIRRSGSNIVLQSKFNIISNDGVMVEWQCMMLVIASSLLWPLKCYWKRQPEQVTVSFEITKIDNNK